MADASAGVAESIQRLEEFLFATLKPPYTIVGIGPEGDRTMGPD